MDSFVQFYYVFLIFVVSKLFFLVFYFKSSKIRYAFMIYANCKIWMDVTRAKQANYFIVVIWVNDVVYPKKKFAKTSLNYSSSSNNSQRRIGWPVGGPGSKSDLKQKINSYCKIKRHIFNTYCLLVAYLRGGILGEFDPLPKQNKNYCYIL